MTDKPTKDVLLAQLADAYQRRRLLDPAPGRTFNRAARDEAFNAELAIVAALRELDVTWQEVGDVIGRKKSNVVVTYARKLETSRTVRVRPNPKEKP
ncbi:hypothetical protein QQG74_09395 [Micromonospora sp. FIMYZ51]|uniref:hypothetical protein n=1 Tax=Micromonospora sp. FIMYZ51 TaxID=3051832 RepID=UPI00311DF8D4